MGRSGILTAILLVALVLPIPAAATLTYDPAGLTVRTENHIAEYLNLKTIPVGIGLSLPADEYLLPLLDGETLDMITVRSPRSYEIAPAGTLPPLYDMPTSDIPEYIDRLSQKSAHGGLGTRAVEIEGVWQYEGQTFARLIVFPVTIGDNEQLIFHPQIDITVRERDATFEELRKTEDITDALSGRDRASRMAANNDTPNYVIITSGDLSDCLQPLVTYKNETGYHTELALIENILPAYEGCDDAEKLREYLKDFYAAGGYYVLLAGDETILPIRYAYSSIAPEDLTLDDMQICDLYFADLTGDWDRDSDGVFGEAYEDEADLSPELAIGRLPVNTCDEAANYIAKLIQYETNPGNGDTDYLTKAFFFASDQMRDYCDTGQHIAIASAYPEVFRLDTISGVEAARGGDPAPSNLSPTQLGPVFADGFGIVNVVAHGRPDGFVVKSSGYNQWPKNYLLASPQSSGHGCFDSIATPGKPNFYYSLACHSGAFDMDQPELGGANPLMVQSLLGGVDGAVGLVAYSRWGWIGSSYLIQKAFFDSLFAHPERPAVEAMYASKMEYYYMLSLVFGQNFFGDPTLRIYTRTPDRLTLQTSVDKDNLKAGIFANGTAVNNCRVILAHDGVILDENETGTDGYVLITHRLEAGKVYTLCAVAPGAIVGRFNLIGSTVTSSVEDDPETLPTGFSLAQNYPNPFNPVTTISFDLPEAASVQLIVYNTLGQTVATLIDGELTVGTHTVDWNGTDASGNEAASGVYFYRLRAAGRNAVRKMVLLR